MWLNWLIKFEGEWEVGFVNVFYFLELRFKDYLLGLKDGDILLKIGCYVLLVLRFGYE